MSEDAHSSDGFDFHYVFDSSKIFKAVFKGLFEEKPEDPETVMLKDLFFLQEMRVAPVKFTPEGKIEVLPIITMEISE